MGIDRLKPETLRTWNNFGQASHGAVSDAVADTNRWYQQTIKHYEALDDPNKDMDAHDMLRFAAGEFNQIYQDASADGRYTAQERRDLAAAGGGADAAVQWVKSLGMERGIRP